MRIQENKAKRLIYTLIAIVFWISIWSFFAWKIDNKIFLPSPASTLSALKAMLCGKEFYDTFEQSNKNVFKKNLIYNDILLRKKNDNSLDFTEEQIKKIERDKNIKKILTDSQNQIIKMYCDSNCE